MANEIQHVSLAVQIDGKPYFVNLEHDRMLLLIQMASGLSDNSKLNVVAAPESFKFMKIGDVA